MQELSSHPLDDDSPTLSQMLTKENNTTRKSFLYPTSSTMSTIVTTGQSMESPRQSATRGTCSTPSYLRPNRASGKKSLGMKRRLKSVENSVSDKHQNATTPQPLLVSSYSPAKKMRNDIGFMSSPSLLGRSTINANNRCNSAPVIKTFSRIGKYKKNLQSKPSISSTMEQKEQTLVQIQQATNENIPSFVGFKTAQNKPINVSNKAKKMAEKLFSQIYEEIDENVEVIPEKEKQIPSSPGPKTIECKKNVSPMHENMSNCESASQSPHKLSDSKSSVSDHGEKSSDFAIGMMSIQNEEVKCSHENKNKNVNRSGISTEESSLDEALLESFESSENLETAHSCPSPILMTKQLNRKKKTAQDSNIESLINLDAPSDNKPSEVEDMSILSDDFEVEMLAIDLTSKFEQVNNDTEVRNNVSDTNQPSETCSEKQSFLKESNVIFDKSERPKARNNSDSKGNYAPAHNEGSTSDLDMEDQMLLEVGAVFDQDWKSSQESQTEETGGQKLGFITASQKPITISACAMKKAEKMMTKINEENDINLQTNSKPGSNHDILSVKNDISSMSTSQNIDSKGQFKSDSLCERNNFVGFQTASNKPVVISEAALQKATQLLCDDELINCNPSENNNSNKTSPKTPPRASTDKLTNLFKKGSNVGKKENKNFKAPRPASNLENSSRMKLAQLNDNDALRSSNVLGTKRLADSQIIVSDESLVKAAEILEDMFT